MTSEQRIICRVASTVDYYPEAADRFNRLVDTHRSWSFAFCAHVAGVYDRPFVRVLQTERFVAGEWSIDGGGA